MPRFWLSTLATLLLAASAAAFAHETQTVGEGDEQYLVTVGFAMEPAFTDERNGLDLIVRTRDEEPVENLANGLTAALTAPTGETMELDLRASFGRPGAYTDDFLMTEPGLYRLHVGGFIGATEIDLEFELHEVAPIDDLRFP